MSEDPLFPGADPDLRSMSGIAMFTSTSSWKGADKARGTPVSLNVLLQLPFFDSSGNKVHEKHEAHVSGSGDCPSPPHPASV